jgi:hypothetical protein
MNESARQPTAGSLRGSSASAAMPQSRSEQRLDMLKQAGILAPDVTMDKIARVASTIQGTGASPASWELVSTSFVLKGLPISPQAGVERPENAPVMGAAFGQPANTADQFQVLRGGGILAQDATLEQVVDMSARLNGAGTQPGGGWEFVSGGYAYVSQAGQTGPDGQGQRPGSGNEAASAKAVSNTAPAQGAGGEHVRLLIQAGIIEPDITLEKLVSAASVLGGPGGSVSIGETFLQSPPIFKSMPAADVTGGAENAPVRGAVDGAASHLGLLKQAGILRSDVTIDRIANVASKLKGMVGGNASWELVSHSFALRGMPVSQGQDIIQR